jgi:hypothetical protein
MLLRVFEFTRSLNQGELNNRIAMKPEPESMIGAIIKHKWRGDARRMSTMNRKTIATVLILIVVGGGAVFLFVPWSSNSFHLEGTHPDGAKRSAYLWLTDLQDCALNVSFVDDLDLLYSIDVELYEPSPAPSAFELTVNDYRTQSGVMDIRFEGILSIKSLQVTLGSGVPYTIVVSSSSSNVNATITYENNVIGSGASLNYKATGSYVNLFITEEMVFSNTGMEIIIGGTGRPDLIYLHTDLPDGVNGLATFKEPLYIQSNTGWAFRSQFLDEVTYSTDPLNNEPLLGMGIRAEYGVYAWLSD